MSDSDGVATDTIPGLINCKWEAILVSVISEAQTRWTSAQNRDVFWNMVIDQFLSPLKECAPLDQHTRKIELNIVTPASH